MHKLFGTKLFERKKLFSRKNIIPALKIILPILYVLVLGFIFGNSLQTGEQSAETSSKVVQTVQAVAQVVAPQSAIATATGEDYVRLHEHIRILAHFAEFAALGVLTCCCCLVYKLKRRYYFIGLSSLAIIPIVDEILQSFTVNRATEFFDFAIDFSGGCVGFGLTLACFYGILWLLKKRNEQRNEKCNEKHNEQRNEKKNSITNTP